MKNIEIYKYRILDRKFSKKESNWLWGLRYHDKTVEGCGMDSLEDLANQLVACEPNILSANIKIVSPALECMGESNQIGITQFGTISDEELSDLGKLILQYAAQRAPIVKVK